MELEALPCPFCGGEADVRRGRRDGVWSVECSGQCSLSMGPATFSPAKDAAVSAWNTRAPAEQHQPPTEVEGLREALRDVLPVLQMLIDPKSILTTTAQQAWMMAVAAEAKVRLALTNKPNGDAK